MKIQDSSSPKRARPQVQDAVPAPAIGDRFTTLHPVSARKAAEHLESAFTWSESREGRDYWAAIFKRLQEIENTPKSEYQLAREAAPVDAGAEQGFDGNPAKELPSPPPQEGLAPDYLPCPACRNEGSVVDGRCLACGSTSPPPEDGLVEALEKARAQFEFYAAEHRQKALAQRYNGMQAAERAAWEKCQTNERLADMCWRALSHHRAGVKT